MLFATEPQSIVTYQKFISHTHRSTDVTDQSEALCINDLASFRKSFALVLCTAALLLGAPQAYAQVDSDGDGIPDSVEGTVDSDGDGSSNHYDLDSDGDGLADAVEGSGDADGDGTANFLDLDSDDDGYTDTKEGGFDRYDPVEVPSSFLEIVSSVLSEGSNVDESFLNPAYQNDLTITGDAEVRVTFIDEGAGYRNAVGYYTFSQDTFVGLTKADVDTDGSGLVSIDEFLALPGVEIGWVFPNSSELDSRGGILVPGDSYVLGDGRIFPTGTKIGFFLIARGWLGNGSLRQPNQAGTSPDVIFTTDFLNPVAEASADLDTDSSTNLSRQVALLFDGQDRSEIIVGFEDISRYRYANGRVQGDQDFNDAVFSVSSNPASALSAAGIVTANTDGTDADGDGVLDVDEQPGDTDGDGTPDVNDPDDDGDGIVTPTEGTDDADGDNTANYLDTDSDNDGIDDSVEGAVDTDLDGTFDFLDTDSDGDGISDSSESTVDSDGDGIADYADSDDDGDGIPTSAEGANDSDGDGTANYLDDDSDGDGISDVLESDADSDSDGTSNYLDTDSDADGSSDAEEGSLDTDSDGTADYLDLDSDADGVSDAVEGNVDTDGDGQPNRVDTDDDGDGLATAFEGLADPDGDGLANYLDTDSNNDGEPDGGGDAVLVATTKAMQVGYTGMPLSSGEQIVYAVTIENTGSDPATTIDVSGMVPSDTDYLSGSLTIDGLASSASLSAGSALRLDSILPGQSVVLQYTVTLTAAIPTDTTWIESVVTVDYLQSDTTEVSDNDTSGHCGIVDDGLDHVSDAGLATDDDDPTRLPLLGAAYYESCTLAFEDLKNAGWNDWDMNDLVLDVTSFYIVNSSNQIECLIVTYEVLARGAGMDSQLYLDLAYNGNAHWQRILLDSTGQIDELVNGTGDGSASIQAWSSSKDVLPAYTTLKHKWGAARTERFDESGVGKAAVITFHFSDPSANPLAEFSESPHDTWIHIPSTQQDIHRVEYDLTSSQIVTEGPLFGRSMPFAVKLDTAFVWPAENQPIWLSHPDYVDYVKSAGVLNEDWASNYDYWRVWFDRQGMMNGGVYNPVSAHDSYKDYVETWSNSD